MPLPANKTPNVLPPSPTSSALNTTQYPRACDGLAHRPEVGPEEKLEARTGGAGLIKLKLHVTGLSFVLLVY